MGYLVETSGRIRLPQELERQALTVLEVRMNAREGWFDADADHVDSLGELATYAAAQVRRDGDWLLVETDADGDPKWSEQASEFYRTLGSFVREGEVRVVGEDGQSWSYLYSGGGVVQRGENGWDGTPGDVPADERQAPPSESPTPAAASGLPTPPGGAPPEATDPSEFHYPGREDRPPPAPTPYAAEQPPSGAYSPGPGLDQPGWVPDPRAESAWADPPPASTGRTVLMATLLVVGVVLIIGLALLVSGL